MPYICIPYFKRLPLDVCFPKFLTLEVLNLGIEFEITKFLKLPLIKLPIKILPITKFEIQLALAIFSATTPIRLS